MIEIQEELWDKEEHKTFLELYLKEVLSQLDLELRGNVKKEYAAKYPSFDKYSSLKRTEKKKYDSKVDIKREEILRKVRSFLGLNKKLSPKETLKNLICLSVDEIMSRKAGITNQSLLASDFRILSKVYSRIIRNSTETEINTSFVEELDILICPYCNRNYINNRKVVRKKKHGKKENKIKSSCQLDHFFTKSDYPIFSLCLNNLIPTCSQCNHTKHENSFDISPYKMNETTKVEFEFIPESEDRFILKSDNKDMQRQIELLGLSHAYKIHKKDVEDLLNRKEIYTSSKLNEFERILNISLSEMTVKELIFGKIHEESEDKKISLSKFRREIIEQIIANDGE